MNIMEMPSSQTPEGFQKRILPTLDVSQEGPSFSELLKQTGLKAIGSLERAEDLSKQAAMGKDIDSQVVALGVVNASSGTRQLTGIISAGMQSYKEIQHMQI